MRAWMIVEDAEIVQENAKKSTERGKKHDGTVSAKLDVLSQ